MSDKEIAEISAVLAGCSGDTSVCDSCPLLEQHHCKRIAMQKAVSAINELTLRTETLKSDNNQLAQGIYNANMNCEQITKELDSCKSEIQTLRHEADTARERNSYLVSQIDNLNGQIAAYQYCLNRR